jgi:hypothetical protein
MLCTKVGDGGREDPWPLSDLNSYCQPFVVTSDQVRSNLTDGGVDLISYAIPSHNNALRGLQWGHDPQMFPDISLIDLQPTRSLPPNVTNIDATNHDQLASSSVQRYPQEGLYWETPVPVSHVTVNRYNSITRSM